ncbi:hypothetical protein CEE45_10100 [Candidatus Heimdallarchaeota archaeon B3_Heim]|nr:MAG: hypothetical protein CEE45_10100 [Candidatus Heimdallarchaeota archaeon B3_Heim]
MTIFQSTEKDVQISRQIALIAAFTAIVFLSTSLFYIPLISSTGFFNLGEAFIYLAAIIGGPIVGAIAGGLGAAMADMVLGYGYFAPATLVLKGLEGFAVGFLFRKSRNIDRNIRYILLGTISLFLIGFSAYVTTPALNGVEGSSIIQITFRLLDPSLIPQHLLDPTIEDVYQTLVIDIPGILILATALLICLIMWFIELRMGEKGQMILSCLLAGPIIVVGYFLYEIFILTLSPDPAVAFQLAVTEVPFNIAQVVFGTSIAIPIVSYLQELGILQDERVPPS